MKKPPSSVQTYEAACLFMEELVQRKAANQDTPVKQLAQELLNEKEPAKASKGGITHG